MPVVAYQSLNANASTSHGLRSMSLQRFTLDANAHATGSGHQALVLPHAPRNLGIPVQGPANLVPIGTLSGGQPASAFGDQISLAQQNFYRAIGSMPDLMVVGEFDASHPDFSKTLGGQGVTITAHPATRACQSFTAISQNRVAAQIVFLAEGEGYVCYAVDGFVVVFVHVPNRIATNENETKRFYENIAKPLAMNGKSIDLIIGDTNQPRFSFSADVMNRLFNTNAYVTAGTQSNITKLDNWNVTERGTNSTGRKMYDVAVYRSDFNRITSGPAYISQSSGAVTVTDHCGLAIGIEKNGKRKRE